MTAKLILIRGLPGSGKSTQAKGLGKEYIHLEADMYHVQPDGTYQFDPNKIKYAHEWCQLTARTLLSQGHSVVVSNTFTTKWEMQPYFNMIPMENIRIYRCTDNFGSIHNVPPETMEKMKNRFEDFNGETLLRKGF